MRPRVSIIIPIYRRGPSLAELLDDVFNDEYPDKEVIVAADCPDGETRELLRAAEARGAKVLLSEKRRGKARALNAALEASTGDILIFLDADVTLGGQRDFIESVLEDMGGADLADICKEVELSSLLSRMAYYEYLAMAGANFIASKAARSTVGVNGAAFAARREAIEYLGGFRRVLYEDLDLATRACDLGLKFTFVTKARVKVHVPGGLKQWLKQRWRWSIGAASWLKDSFGRIYKATASKPHVFVSGLFLILPALALPVSGAIASWVFPHYAHVALSLLYLLAFKFLPPLQFSLTLLSLSTAALGTFTAFAAVYFLLAKLLRFRFSLPEFAVYYFVYSPFWVLMLIAGLIIMAVAPSRVKVDWKV